MLVKPIPDDYPTVIPYLVVQYAPKQQQHLERGYVSEA